MEPLAAFAIVVLAGAIIVLLYYSLQEARSPSLVKFRSGISDIGERVSEGVYNAGGRFTETETGEGEGRMAGVSGKFSEVGEMIRGKVREVPISTDGLSGRIDSFLDEKSDQLIKDWELATKSDISDLEKRFSKVSRDIGELESRFNEFRGHTNKRIENIEERLDVLEGSEEKTE